VLGEGRGSAQDASGSTVSASPWTDIPKYKEGWPPNRFLMSLQG
jgi:hypothetical protein